MWIGFKVFFSFEGLEIEDKLFFLRLGFFRGVLGRSGVG